MKTHKSVLDVDIIGEPRSLTAEEKENLSIYFENAKSESKNIQKTPRKHPTNRSRIKAKQ